MRTSKVALRKAIEWKGNPMMVSGLYRLFTYVKWSQIPEEYKSYFPKEAETTWDDDLTTYNERDILLDIDSEIRALIQVLAKKNITHCLGLVPMIIADAYMYGIPTAMFQAELTIIIKQYKDNIGVDRALAEQYAIIALFYLLDDIVKKLKLKLSFDLKSVRDRILNEIGNAVQTEVTPNLSDAIDRALKEYNEKQKENESKANVQDNSENT